MPMIEADLHNHTTYSDGSLPPTDLIAWGKERQLRAMAVTDHDTVAGCLESLAEGSRQGLEIIPGIELTVRFTTDFFTGSVHYLLYFSPEMAHDPEFRHAVSEVAGRGRGEELFRRRVAAINRHFGPESSQPLLPRPLLYEEVQTLGSNLTRRHIVVAMTQFLGLSDRTIINRIIGNDSPAYLPSGIDLEDLAPLLRAYPHMLRVLAHPAAGSFPGDSHYKEVLPPWPIVKRLLPKFLELGLDGFEINYPGHTPEQREELEALRLRLHLPLAAGGSDCHDATLRPLAVEGVKYEVVAKMKELFTADPSLFTHRSTAAL